MIENSPGEAEIQNWLSSLTKDYYMSRVLERESGFIPRTSKPLLTRIYVVNLSLCGSKVDHRDRRARWNGTWFIATHTPGVVTLSVAPNGLVCAEFRNLLSVRVIAWILNSSFLDPDIEPHAQCIRYAGSLTKRHIRVADGIEFPSRLTGLANHRKPQPSISDGDRGPVFPDRACKTHALSTHCPTILHYL